MKYELKKRAERQQETRRRIVEATLALHTEVGPARTTISAIAERARVQRHTVYSHFPDDDELLAACSGLHAEQHPLPAPAALTAIDDGEKRLRTALEGLYAYFAEHEQLMANIHRDLETHAPTRTAVHAQMGPFVTELLAVLAAGLPARGAAAARRDAALGLVTSFWSWRGLARDHGLAPAEAAAVAAAMVHGALASGTARGR